MANEGGAREPDKNGKAPGNVLVWQMNEDARIWLKNHRTFVASMSSSVVSTYVAVSEARHTRCYFH